MTPRILLTLLPLICCAPCRPADPLDDLSGKRGAGLAEALRVMARPRVLPADGDISYSTLTPFEGTQVTVTAGRLPAGYVWGEAVPALWWSIGSLYGDTIARDMVNRIPMSTATATHRGDLPPGRSVESAGYTAPLWCSGTATLSGIETELYAPPAEWRGALARKFFYMAACYPSNVFTPRGYMIFAGGSYPALTSYAAAMFMEWHRDYPVDETEIALDRLAREWQGSGNPFVLSPELADYLWGDKADTPYSTEGATPALHGSYRMADGEIWLHSPHIPTDAVWSVDGRRVSGNRLTTAELGAGHHTLAYTCGGEKGYLTITICP